MDMNMNGGANNGRVRRRPPPTTAPYTPTAAAPSHSYGTNEEDAPLLPSQNEEGYYYPVHHQSYAVNSSSSRRRSHGGGPWYRQPQKLILAATLAWVGGVMYLASLAHAILRTHKETANNLMGVSSLVDGNEDFKQWLESEGMLKKTQGPHTRKKTYGATSGGGEKGEDFQNWLESRGNKYGASGETNEDFQNWLESQGNKYGASGETNEDYQQWLESQVNKVKYGSSAETNEDFQQWLESQANKNKYGASSSTENGDAWQDWVASVKQEKSGYGSTSGNKSGQTNNNVNVRFGNSDASYQEWLEYQDKNKEAKYNANGMYGKSSQTNNNVAASRSMGDSQQQAFTATEQVQQPVVATSDSSSSISTIDWPLQGLPHASCTSSNGCSPSTNVTVLIVYGPEYHTHISEMAWNVATGVHTAFQTHIRHHPSSPLHGHIVFGHTSNVTFLDVMDADSVIIGSPVYNGNVHPDVQNWINYWHIDADLTNKFGGAFATAGGIHAGADGTIMSILRSMMVFQMMAVGGDSWTSPFGAVATMYEDPFGETRRTGYFDSSCYYTEQDGKKGEHLVHPYFLRKAYGLGERIANVTVAWKNSSY
ncbi:hypothetical protein ACHAXR_011872, partial [Thalassiosira sp. AJA248-18]